MKSPVSLPKLMHVDLDLQITAIQKAEKQNNAMNAFPSPFLVSTINNRNVAQWVPELSLWPHSSPLYTTSSLPLRSADGL